MRFVESTKYEVTDVRMGFYNSNHSNDEPFDGGVEDLGSCVLVGKR